MDRKFRHCCTISLAALVLSPMAVQASGQALPTTAPQYPPMANSNGRTTSDPNVNRTPGMDFPTSMDPNFAHRQMVARREDLKRRMVENATRLLVLTRALEADLQGREATDEDAKRLDEIAKLAHTVREQMRQ